MIKDIIKIIHQQHFSKLKLKYQEGCLKVRTDFYVVGGNIELLKCINYLIHWSFDVTKP